MDETLSVTGDTTLGNLETALNFTLQDGDEFPVVMKIQKGKFFWKGEEVEDKYEVYERFNEWPALVEQQKNNYTLN